MSAVGSYWTTKAADLRFALPLTLAVLLAAFGTADER